MRRKYKVLIVIGVIACLVFLPKYIQNQKVEYGQKYGMYSSLISIEKVLENTKYLESTQDYEYAASSLKQVCNELEYEATWLPRNTESNVTLNFQATYMIPITDMIQNGTPDKQGQFFEESRAIVRTMLAKMSVDGQLSFDEYGLINNNVNPYISLSEIEKILLEGSEQQLQLNRSYGLAESNPQQSPQ